VKEVQECFGQEVGGQRNAFAFALKNTGNIAELVMCTQNT